MPAMEEIIRIVPAACFIITGTACRVNRKVERTFAAIISSYSAALVSTSFL